MNSKIWKEQHPALKATILFAFTGIIMAGIAMFFKIDIPSGFQAIFASGLTGIGAFSSLNYWNKKKYEKKEQSD